MCAFSQLLHRQPTLLLFEAHVVDAKCFQEEDVCITLPFTGTDVTCCISRHEKVACEQQSENGVQLQLRWAGTATRTLPLISPGTIASMIFLLNFLKSSYSYSNKCLREHLWVLK